MTVFYPFQYPIIFFLNQFALTNSSVNPAGTFDHSRNAFYFIVSVFIIHTSGPIKNAFTGSREWDDLEGKSEKYI